MVRSHKYLLIGLIALNAAAALLLALSRTDYRVNLSSVVEIWGDIVRDVDRFGRTITTVSVEKEIEIGNEIAKSFHPVTDEHLQRYIDKVGRELTPHARRRGIPYKFQVIDWSVVNAFAVAGGHIYITNGMLASIESEAELAGILAHEIAHIDLKHCIQQLQYELVLRRVVGDDLAAVAGIAQYLLTVSYSEQQEREADRVGMIMMAEAGYSPIEATKAFVDIGTELGPLPDQPVKPERPELEIGRAIEEALGDYFETHPVWADRVRDLDTILQRNMASWERETFYIGRSNYSDRIPRSEDHRINETIVYSPDLPELQMLRGELLSRIGNQDQAIKLFRKAANQGFADAQYKLGVAHYHGRGVPQNYTMAVKWYRLAAEQGHVEAEHNLAGMYREGKGTPQDLAEAVKWYRMAAEQAHVEAQYSLGLMYRDGLGVPRDWVQAYQWWTVAADQGHRKAVKTRDALTKWMSTDRIAEAQYSLGHSYASGLGVRQNSAEAVKWYRMAAEQAHVEAQYSLGLMYRDGLGVPRDWVQAYQWWTVAADQGHRKAVKTRDNLAKWMSADRIADAQYSLGVMYTEGEGVAQDDTEAVKWYRLAAEQGHILAQTDLGVMYERGQGVPQDDAEAVKWYRMAAEHGYLVAQYNLGVAYANGRGLPRDYAEAVKWYRKAAEQGHAGAQYNLGYMYAMGKGVERDYAETVKWLHKAAEQGHAWAQYNLGVMYTEGEGVPQDDAEAMKWYRLAAEQGHAEAQSYLATTERTGPAKVGSFEHGMAAYQRGNYALTLKFWRPLAEQGDARAQYNLGGMYRRGQGVPQDGAEAVKWFRLAAKQGHAEAQYSLGGIFEYGIAGRVAQDDAEAVKWYRKAAEQGHAQAQIRLPKLANRYFKRGREHSKNRQFKMAIADFTRVIEIDPDYKSAYRNRGDAYREQGMFDPAIADYNRAIEIDPGYARAYINRGDAYDDNGQFDLAIADYTKAIEIDPGYARAFNNRGWTYKKQGDLDRAIADFTRAIEINPDYKLAYNNRGWTYRVQGYLDLAIADFTHAIEIDPEYDFAYANRCMIRRIVGELELAMSDCNKAIGISDNQSWDYSWAYIQRAQVHREMGSLEEATVDFRKSLEPAPSEVVKRLQGSMTQVGFYKGSIDGELNENLIVAIRQCMEVDECYAQAQEWLIGLAEFYN